MGQLFSADYYAGFRAQPNSLAGPDRHWFCVAASFAAITNSPQIVIDVAAERANLLYCQKACRGRILAIRPSATITITL